MQGIASMRTYSPYDLASLLGRCADGLAEAYQELCDRNLNRLSMEAYSASDFLSFIAAKNQSDHQVH